MRLREVFVDACELDDPDARASFLADACQGDLLLRQQVEELLREREELDSFLEPSPMTAIAVDPQEKIGSIVGPYRLRELLGEGGFGVVYVAEQESPVRRVVALKLIKPGMDSREVLSRFEAERQTLALMDHPNIARVLDAGKTDIGRPYVVMEFVRGIPITRFCETDRLSVKARLKIFIDVCRAVQHAHQKAVIHRHLKPTNILVELNDGKAIPR